MKFNENDFENILHAIAIAINIDDVETIDHFVEKIDNYDSQNKIYEFENDDDVRDVIREFVVEMKFIHN